MPTLVPVSLEFQCLVFLVDHLNEIPYTALAQLPARIRRQLLLLLPAVDLCHLEMSPVISGIEMDEIWKELYIEKVDLMKKKNEYNDYAMSMQDLGSYFNVTLTPKEGYFDLVLSIAFSSPSEFMPGFFGCECQYAHVVFDFLYGSFSKSLFPFANLDQDHNCYTFAQFFPRRYLDLMEEFFKAKGLPNNTWEYIELVDLNHVISLLVNVCGVSMKVFDQSHVHDYETMSHLTKDSKANLVKLFSSVEAVAVDIGGYCCCCREIFDIIFNPSTCQVKTLIVKKSNEVSDLQELNEIIFPHQLEQYLENVELTTFKFEHDYNNWVDTSSAIHKQKGIESIWMLHCSIEDSEGLNVVSFMMTELNEFRYLKELCIKNCTIMDTALECIMSSSYPLIITVTSCDFISADPEENEGIFEVRDMPLKLIPLKNGKMKSLKINDCILPKKLLRSLFCNC